MSKLIQFYRPQKKAKVAPTAEAPVEQSDDSAKKVLSTLAENAGPIEDVLVLMRLNNGKMDFLGNLGDLDEMLAFIEDFKFKIMHYRNGDGGNGNDAV